MWVNILTFFLLTLKDRVLRRQHSTSSGAYYRFWRHPRRWFPGKRSPSASWGRVATRQPVKIWDIISLYPVFFLSEAARQWSRIDVWSSFTSFTHEFHRRYLEQLCRRVPVPDSSINFGKMSHPIHPGGIRRGVFHRAHRGARLLDRSGAAQIPDGCALTNALLALWTSGILRRGA